MPLFRVYLVVEDAVLCRAWTGQDPSGDSRKPPTLQWIPEESSVKAAQGDGLGHVLSLVLFRYLDAARRNPREELQDKDDLANVREAFLIKEYTVMKSGSCKHNRPINIFNVFYL